MIVTKRTLPRRTVLRGLGTTVALPLLDSMVPALTALERTVANPKPRLGVVYVPHGAVMNNWTPSVEGHGFEFTPILQPLEPFRDRLLVLSGLDHAPAAQLPGDPAGGHGRITGAFLTGVHAKPTEGADFEAGTSMDQIAARALGRHTQLASLEVGIGLPDFGGACDAGFSCAYISTLSWSTPTTPLPMESNPRALFERLFGDGTSTDPIARRERMRQDQSILDAVTQKVARLQSGLGAADRAKLTDYLAAVRDVERRIQRAEQEGGRELPVVERPSASVPPSFSEYVKLMFDLQVLAYQTDLTRVITFLMTPELTAQTYPEIGVPDPHHALSHHENKPESLAKLTKVGGYHAELFAYYLDRLRTTTDGDGTLLDQVMILYGSGMSNSNLHNIQNLPLVLAGGGAGRLNGGRHVQFAPETRLTNLFQTLLGKLDVPVEQIGDSTGTLAQLTDV
ncbi:MAG: DUF1552 domain-containing protein [Acidobacteriota bacterium]|nr:DUF1552 domain-containing protein [Acidobacteriota bacterium]